jgi:ABC-2 type transport system permease protein
LITRDLKLRYEGALLGYLWTVFEPLLLTGVYYVVFGLVARFQVPNYPFFLIIGLLPWTWFNTSLRGSSTSITRNAGLFGKVYIPRQLAPLSVVGAKAVEFLASLPILVVAAVIAGRSPNIGLLWWIPALAIQATASVGLALLVSALNAIARDVERILVPALRAGFYATPVLYPLSAALERFPDLIQWVIYINPLVGPLELYRLGFYPEQFVGWTPVISSAAISTLLLIVGWTVFKRLEPTILKEL